VGRRVLGRGPCRERSGDRSIWGRGGSRGRVGGRGVVVEVHVEVHVVWVKGELGTGGVAVDKDDVDGLKVLEESVEVAEMEATAGVVAALGE